MRVLLVFTIGLQQAKAKLPDWLEESVKDKAAIEAFDGSADGLALLDEQIIEYRGRGEIRDTVRRVFYLYNRDAKDLGAISIPMSKEGRLSGFNGWIIYKSGKVETLKKRDLVEFAADRDKLRADSKVMEISRIDSMRDGTVFAYEYTYSRKSVFLQGFWRFSQEIPVAKSRLSVELPNDWELRQSIFNAPFARYEKNGSRHRWRADNVEAVKVEDQQPFRSLITGNLGYTILPSASEMKRFNYEVFESWRHVAEYVSKIQEDQIAANGAISRKVSELIAGKESEWEKVVALCRYAQSVNYLAMAIDLDQGGGYRPQRASDVFEKHYGDCKDMTALARSMLAEAGIASYPLVAQIGEDSWIYDDWASPHAFNHCLLAVELDESAPDSSGVFQHPKLGSLLIFDPTSKDAAPGVLPHYLEGRRVLLGHEFEESLVTLPVFGPDSNRLDREIEASIDERGTLDAVIVETSRGMSAERMRHFYRSLERGDFEKMIRSWIGSGTRDALISEIECTDQFEENIFELRVVFRAQQFGRFMNRGDLLVFNPVFISQLQWVPPVDDERSTPFEIGSIRINETTKIKGPDGYALESLPATTFVESDFGQYSLGAEYSEGEVIVNRSREQTRTIIPVSGYSSIVEFYEKIARAESANALLQRQALN